MSTPAYRWVYQPTFEALEDGIVAALSADPTIAGYTTEIHPFQGSLESAMQQTSMRLPSVLVVFAGFDEEPEGMVDQEVKMEVHLLIRAANLRGPARAQNPTSAGDQVGAYQVIRDVTRVLRGSDLGLEGLSPIRVDNAALLAAQGGPRGSSVAYQVVLFATGAAVPDLDAADLTEIVTTISTPNGDGEFRDVAADDLTELDA